MANKRISALDPLTTPADGDILPITDISDTTTSGSADGTTKGVTVANLHSGLQAEPTEGAFVDGDKTKLDAAIQPSGITNMVETTDSIDVLVDVDTSTVAPTTNDFLKWDGSNWFPAVPTADVDTPLTTALRGTDNPHIGAYPNQSFNVTDNPSNSVMLASDADGTLNVINSLGKFAIPVGLSVSEDSTEPDIEITTTSGTYSLISGDSDTKGANGLPIRQGFNLPDIGAYPAPLLISGGTIA